jgi:hypothetical protein
MPKDITINGGYKAKFLHQQPKRREQLALTLRPLFADLQVSDTDIIVKCTLTPEVSGARMLARTWAAQVREAVNAYLGSLLVMEVEVLSQVAASIEEAVRQDVPNTVMVHLVTQPKAAVVLVGKSHTVCLFGEF